MSDTNNVIIERLKAIEKRSNRGTPYWMAREIMGVLEYKDWRDFLEVVQRAKASCENAGNFVANHFVLVPELVEIGSGAKRQRDNFALSKYACYLIAMNGDTAKPEIATAQAYFVEQTYRQESQEQLSDAERRLLQRERVIDANRKLGGAAKEAGVRSKMFGIFQDEGYKGLYGGIGVKAIKQKKGIAEKDNLLESHRPKRNFGSKALRVNSVRLRHTTRSARKYAKPSRISAAQCLKSSLLSRR